MNYIYQLNAFWEKFDNTDNRKAYHGFVYLSLLAINNNCAWKRKFDVTFEQILDKASVDKDTYYKAVDFLNNNGFFDYYEKGKNQFSKATFSLKMLYDISESEPNANRTQTEGTPPSVPNNLKHTNNKQVNNKNNNIPDEIGGNDSKVISIGDSEKELFNQALKCFYDYYQNHYGTKYNFTAKDGSHLKQLLKKIESKCREGDKLTDNQNILTAFQYFIGNITDKWILSNFTLPIINSKFNEIIINLKNGNDPKLKTRRTINGITGYYSDEDVELLQFYYQSAG